MASQVPAAPDVAREAEEAGFYHEATLNAAWTGTRLAIGALMFLFAAFAFAYFYLRSLNSHQMWHPAGFKGPQQWAGAVVMGLIVVSAGVQTAALQRIKAGTKSAWQAGAAVALLRGLAPPRPHRWHGLDP